MKIKSVIIAAIAFVFSSAYTPATQHNLRPSATVGSYTLIKGQLIDKGNDGTWDVLSFGLKTEKANFQVTKVQVEQDGFIETYTDLGRFKDNGTSWYFLDISDLALSTDEDEYFYTRIFIRDQFGGIISLAAAAIENGSSPSDPDETVIVVKWP
jgi:hypothetical protein